MRISGTLIFGCLWFFLACAQQVTAGPQTWEEAEQYAPIQQRQFCDLTKKHRRSLTQAVAARNDIKINLTEKQRQLDLDALVPGGYFENWVVKVVSVRQIITPKIPDIDGNAAVVFELWCGTQIGSGVFDFDGNTFWGATIDYGSREYREAVKFEHGDFAIVSGNFLRMMDFVPYAKETTYAVRPLTSNDLQDPSNKVYSNGGELFLAAITYMASAN